MFQIIYPIHKIRVILGHLEQNKLSNLKKGLICFSVYLFVSFLSITVASAQGNVGIGTATPDNNAMLDISSTSKGVLFPRLSTAQRDAIPQPIPTSLTIFNTSTNCLEFYVGNMWHPIACPCDNMPATPIASAASNITATAFTANWQSVLGAIGYFLDVATDPTFNNILPNYNNLGVGNLTTLNINGLACATTYYFRVRAFNKYCTTESSNAVAVYTRTPSGKQVFTYTGANQVFEVPCGVNSISVKIWAAGGGGNGGGESGGSGGAGAYVTGTYTTSGGTLINVTVGQGGASNRNSPSGNVGAASFGGGGRGFLGIAYNSGSGGGLSGIALGSTYIAVAGAGGGGGSFYSTWPNASTNRPTGGPGGSTTNGYDGGSSANGGGRSGANGGAGGTGSSILYNGGAGTSNQGGDGKGTTSGGGAYYFGGGGGGGYIGGGGGGGGSTTAYIGGGGGGSSYISGTGFTGTNSPGTLSSRLASNPPPNTSDADYISGVGVGGGTSGFNNGGNGLVVITW